MKIFRDNDGDHGFQIKSHPVDYAMCIDCHLFGFNQWSTEWVHHSELRSEARGFPQPILAVY